jgi:hypothetical protein
MKVIGIIAISVVLTGCLTTPYQKRGSTGGYEDQMISEGTFYIKSKVNADTPPEKALEYWHRRASELCGHSNYKADVKETYDTNINYGTVTSVHKWPVASGHVYCAVSS